MKQEELNLINNRLIKKIELKTSQLRIINDELSLNRQQISDTTKKDIELQNIINWKQLEVSKLNEQISSLSTQVDSKNIVLDNHIKIFDKKNQGFNTIIKNHKKDIVKLVKKKNWLEKIEIEYDNLKSNNRLERKQLIKTSKEKDDLEKYIDKKRDSLNDKELWLIEREWLLVDDESLIKKQKRELALKYNKMNKFCKDNWIPYIKL